MKGDVKFLVYCVVLLLISIILIDLVLETFTKERVRTSLRSSRPIQRTGRRRREDLMESDDLEETWKNLSDFDKDILRNDMEEAYEEANEELKNIEAW